MPPYRRPQPPAFAKPASCGGCPLETKGLGFSYPDGPTNANVLLVGEALGEQEVIEGKPFVGVAGGMLSRVLAKNGWSREQFRIANCVSCQPPNNWLEGAPWEQEALQHCSQYLDPILAEPHQVIVPMGGVALRRVLGLGKAKGIRVLDFHGTLNYDASGRAVVPTFHPSYLARGATNLLGVQSFDLKVAHEVAAGTYQPQPANLVLDPPLDWFQAWVDQLLTMARQYPGQILVHPDIETPDKAGGKDEGELGADDQSYTILRVNFGCTEDEGITVPFVGPYIDLIFQVLAEPTLVKAWWNGIEYDLPRILKAGGSSAGTNHDGMWLWHLLQSDLPRGLGFVAPLYSRYGAWKHLANSDPAQYGAIDGVQGYRVCRGVMEDLQSQGQWPIAERHVTQLLNDILKPAQIVGIQIDRPRLEAFKHDLDVKARRLLHQIQACVPDELRPLTPKGGLTRRPEEGRVHSKGSSLTVKGTPKKGKVADVIKQELYAQTATIVERVVPVTGYICRLCGVEGVTRTHRCDRTRDRDLLLETFSAPRYFWQEPFNPDSPLQLLAYIKHQHHQPGKAKKTKQDTTDAETLKRLAKQTSDPLYQHALDYRAVGKVKGTYVEGTLRRLDPESRVHPVPTLKPSTMRTSYMNPNIQNVVQDRGGAESLAAGFRKCVVAGPDCRLLEVDYSGGESVETGWFIRDPTFIRFAKLGIHAYLASHKIGDPPDLSASDADILAHLKQIKGKVGFLYDQCKRTVHGVSYGLSDYGLYHTYAGLFKSQKEASALIDFFFSLAPGIPAWQNTCRQRAFEQGFLGGVGDHPFGYKHWFWQVYNFQKLTEAEYYRYVARKTPVTRIQGQPYAIRLGEDAKRTSAFYPQSTLSGVLKEVLHRLFHRDSSSYIGDTYYGKTPLRAPIHDSLLLEVPVKVWDRVYETVCLEMLRPIPQQPMLGPLSVLGPYLTIGIAAKASVVGGSWAEMTEVSVAALSQLGQIELHPTLAAEAETSPTVETYAYGKESEEEDITALGTVA